jgi:hypothetical protein
MFGEEGYMRTLTAAEQAVAEAESDEESDQALGEAEALRDFYFGFEGGRADRGEEEDGAGEEDEEDEAGEEENGTGETGDGDGEGEFISSREAGLSGPFEPSGEEAAAPAAATAAGEAAPAAAAAAAEEAPPPATAQLYEPSWLRYE